MNWVMSSPWTQCNCRRTESSRCARTPSIKPNRPLTVSCAIAHRQRYLQNADFRLADPVGPGESTPPWIGRYAWQTRWMAIPHLLDVCNVALHDFPTASLRAARYPL